MLEENRRKEETFGNYFLCGNSDCYGVEKMVGFGPELEHWNDLMCEYCAERKLVVNLREEDLITPPSLRKYHL